MLQYNWTLPGITLGYVRCHQDQDRHNRQLSLLAWLNVNADQRAGKFQDAHGMERPLVLLSPLTKAHLLLPEEHSQGSTIKSCNTKPQKTLLEYIRLEYTCQKNG